VSAQCVPPRPSFWSPIGVCSDLHLTISGRHDPVTPARRIRALGSLLKCLKVPRPVRECLTHCQGNPGLLQRGQTRNAGPYAAHDYVEPAAECFAAWRRRKAGGFSLPLDVARWRTASRREGRSWETIASLGSPNCCAAAKAAINQMFGHHDHTPLCDRHDTGQPNNELDDWILDIGYRGPHLSACSRRCGTIRTVPQAVPSGRLLSVQRLELRNIFVPFAPNRADSGGVASTADRLELTLTKLGLYGGGGMPARVDTVPNATRDVAMTAILIGA